MAKQGIYKISGNTKPKVGERVTYKIDEWYPATPREKRNPALVTWHLFKKVNGKFVPTTIKKVGISSFTFNTNAYKDTFRIEAYLHNPEGKAPMALEIQPQPNDVPRINKVELKYIDNTPGTVFNFMEKLVAEAKCMNLEGQYLQFTLWEDDTTDAGHDNKNLMIDSKKGKVINGTARVEFMLTQVLMKKAMQGETNPQQLQFYVTVEYYSNKKHATNNVNINTPEELRIPSGQPQPQPQPQQPAPAPEQTVEPQTAHGQANNTQPATPPVTGGVSPATVNPVKTEDLLDAYFAKKEYTKQTGEEDGSHTYTFGGSKSGNKTATAEEKNKVAQTILNKVKDSLKSQKKYTTLETIATALTAEAYGKDTANEKTVSFKTFKLGADFKKVDSAPLDDKLYLVARTMLLDGKQVTISIKEKDGIIKGSQDAILPVMEITEAQMEQKTPTETEVPGTEKTVFTGTVKDNMVKIPIHLRPKSEEELKQWREKISKGKEDGTYTYKFGGATSIKNANEKKAIATIILKNAKEGNRGNSKIEAGKTSSVEEIEKALEIKDYSEGNTITFKLLKKVPEFLYLHAKAQGEKQYDKKFLNKEGAYFQIGNKCPRCEAEITLKDIETAFDVYSNQKDFRQKIVDSLNKFIKQRKNEGKDLHLNTCLRKAHFFAQVAVETLGIHGDWIIEGKINHSVESAKSAFGERAETLERKHLLAAYCQDRPQKRLLNYMYALGNGFDNGNGNEASGDGWKFRGRGLKQITGRGNYKDISEVIKEIFPVEYNALPQGNAGEEKLVSHPEKTEEIDYAVITALAYWEKHKIWELADTITSKVSPENDFKKIRKKVVGKSGFKWTVAKSYFQKTYDAFRVNECSPGEKTSSVRACTPESSQCFNYADVWENPVISSDNGGKNNNRYGSSKRGHKGIDILSGPTYKDVHSIMCGTVEKIVTTFKTNQYGSLKLGNVVNIKSKDKNGNTVYILYCHLDKIYVTEGQKVTHGEKIALSGSTGNASDGSLPNGVSGRGIKKENWHVHIEACSNGAGLVTFFGKDRLQPEDYMKTKFDTNGNAIK